MKFLIKALLNILPFALLFLIMYIVSYNDMTLRDMLIISTLGTIGFIGLAILADHYSEKLLSKKS